MVRIKGANSDYQFKDGSIQEVKGDHPVYLKIFLCPYDMPSPIEEPDENGWCEGTDEQCPHGKKNGEKSPGHALICLHQEDGISLETNNNVTATGPLVAEKGIVAKQEIVAEEKIVAKNKIVVEKGITIKDELVLDISEAKAGLVITMKGEEILRLNISEQGDIELSPLNPSKTLKINGNLEVTEGLTVAGKELPI
ncbi:hypothetical protein [Moorena sp. SIO4G3]|uniref:hypothetical protein n=1 Tax=Moorena sp. SIO4G3 TaxID=2607821 RepID=UPI00142D0BEB|nr:hypothetical protein [Moorena sp. SIO4G3]NEO75990.1 hypothetical protein [Moorena sp. SIO4G3]